jgi:hypothetical protein
MAQSQNLFPIKRLLAAKYLEKDARIEADRHV